MPAQTSRPSWPTWGRKRSSRRPGDGAGPDRTAMGWFCFSIAGAMLLAVGWLVVQDRRQRQFRRRWNERRCMACGYDLRAGSGTCPECGTAAPERLDLPRLRRVSRATSGLSPDAPLSDGRTVFETFAEPEATLLCRVLDAADLAAERVLYVDRRYASLIGYRVRVAPADVDRAIRLKSAFLRPYAGD